MFLKTHPRERSLIRKLLGKTLEDISDSALQPDDFIPILYNPYTLYNGKRWAILYDGDTHVLFYRKSLLKKHNLAPLETCVCIIIDHLSSVLLSL